MSNLLFETARLYVRHLLPTDEAPYIVMHADSAVMDPIPAPTMTDQEAEADLQKQIVNQDKLDVKVKIYAIVGKESHEFMGTCALVVMDRNQAEIGYRFIKTFWGRGYGFEVAQGLISFAFDKMDFNSVLGIADTENHASIKILKRLLVFQKEEIDLDSGRPEEHYVLLKEDYLTRNADNSY